MAGVDTEIEGEARPQKDIRIGYLPQEPSLDDDLDVRANVELGVAETMAILQEYNEISDRFAGPMDDDTMAELLERQGDLSLHRRCGRLGNRQNFWTSPPTRCGYRLEAR